MKTLLVCAVLLVSAAFAQEPQALELIPALESTQTYPRIHEVLSAFSVPNEDQDGNPLGYREYSVELQTETGELVPVDLYLFQNPKTKHVQQIDFWAEGTTANDAFLYSLSYLAGLISTGCFGFTEEENLTFQNWYHANMTTAVNQGQGKYAGFVGETEIELELTYFSDGFHVLYQSYARFDEPGENWLTYCTFEKLEE